MYLAAAIIGATFNPWMIFHQQSAVAEKRLLLCDITAARWDTGIGAVLTQCLTGAIVIAAAATLRSGLSSGLDNVGEISDALSPLLGEAVGRLVFSVGVLGASMVAAIVCSLALTWAVSEVTGHRHALEFRPFEAKWFFRIDVACMVGAAALVWLVRDLVWLNIAAQVLNAFLLPLVIGLLVALAVDVLPDVIRPRGIYLWVLIGVSAIVIAVGLVDGVSVLV
jgi:Mn2+/Fe2+ NRAMP family transporter